MSMNRENRTAEFVSGDKTGKSCDNNQAAQANRQAQQQDQGVREYRTTELASDDQTDKQSQQQKQGGARRAH
ncbi:hypothetical protein CPB97_001880 [Podila verticillata]|nr:hypothetical protein CPB97_001880 [Podila verticillata]